MRKPNHKMLEKPAADAVQKMLDHVSVPQIEALSECGFDGASEFAASLAAVDIQDDGSIALFLKVECTAVVKLDRLLSHCKREGDEEDIASGLKAENAKQEALQMS